MAKGFDPIPGETPIDDISGLIPKEVKTRAELNPLEAENIRKAIRATLRRPSKRQAPFTLDWCYKLHSQMFGDVWNWAGTPRKTELNLGVPFYQVEVDLMTLLDDLAYWRERNEIDKAEQAVLLHHRAVYIHPFLNGNGRWSRMLANIFLKQERLPIIMWPDETIGETSVIRNEYLLAIRAADQGDYAPLTAMHRKYRGIP